MTADDEGGAPPREWTKGERIFAAVLVVALLLFFGLVAVVWLVLDQTVGWT